MFSSQLASELHAMTASAQKVRPLRCTKSPSSKKALDVPEQCCGLSLSTLTRRGSTDGHPRTPDALQTRVLRTRPYRLSSSRPEREARHGGIWSWIHWRMKRSLRFASVGEGPDWRIAC